MHPGRIVGVFIGVVMLASILLLPFSDIISRGAPPETLWNIFVSFINNIGTVQPSNVSYSMDLAFVYQVATILLVVGCIVGVYPAGSGALGVIGLSFATFGPYEVSGAYASSPANFGSGFYVLWVASIVQIVLAFWTRRGERREGRMKEIAHATGLGTKASAAKAGKAGRSKVPARLSAAASPPKVCPTCGSTNPFNAIVCIKCASPL